MEIYTEKRKAEILLREYSELGSPNPGLLNWFISLLALTTIVIFMLYGAQAARGLRFARLQHQFAFAAKETDDVEALMNTKRYLPLFEAQKKMIRAIQPLFGMLTSGEFSRAYEMLTRVDTPKHPLVHTIATRLRAMAEEDRHFQKLQQDERFFQGTEPNLWARYRDLRGRASDLLGIKVASSGGREYAFYKEGILTGVPKLRGVPDGVESIDTLSAYQPVLRKKFESELKNIENELRNLGSLGQALQEQVAGLQTRADERNAQVQAMDERRRRNQREANYLVRRFAVELTKQSFPLDMRNAYEQLRVYARRFKKDLPELLIEENMNMLSEEDIAISLDS